MIDRPFLFINAVFFLLIISCKNTKTPVAQQDDPLLVSYADKQLKYSDVLEHVGVEINEQDSQMVVSNFIDGWIKDQVLIKEAKAQIKDQSEIDKLTEDFRNDLLLLKFEEQLIKSKLDTVISDQELIAYYQSNKSRYKLESTIFRFIFIKANKPIADPKNLENIWKTQNASNLQMLNIYCQNNADICFINPDRWYKWEEIKQYIPSKFLSENSIHGGTSKDFADVNYAYKIKFFEVVRPNQDPPLSFLREQATQAILHQRKIQLLDRIKAELYEQELKEKKIIFTNK
jgi:hypothetical protein